MTDLALIWDNDAAAADIVLERGQLRTDEGLRTAVLLSLFTDARAANDDSLPEPDADRRGWWGNAFPAIEGDRGHELGSRLWLLDRAKTTTAVIVQARQYALEALQWLIDDQIAIAIDVTVERQKIDATEMLAIRIEIQRPDGPARQRFDFLWEASA